MVGSGRRWWSATDAADAVTLATQRPREAMVELRKPTVGLASLRCALFRNSETVGHVAFAVAGVHHGSDILEISCPRSARPTVASRTGEHLQTNEPTFFKKYACDPKPTVLHRGADAARGRVDSKASAVGQ